LNALPENSLGYGQSAFFLSGNQEYVKSYDPKSGEISLCCTPKHPNPTCRCIPFDCAISERNERDCRWFGANHSIDLAIEDEDPARIIYWHGFDSFSTYYTCYDTTVVCVSCPK